MERWLHWRFHERMRGAKRKCSLQRPWSLFLPRRCRLFGWKSREGRESQGSRPSVRQMQDRPWPKSIGLPKEGFPRLLGVPLYMHIGRRVEVRGWPSVGQASAPPDPRRLLETRWKVGKAGFELLREKGSESPFRPILPDSLRQDYLGVVSTCPFSRGAWEWTLGQVIVLSGWSVLQVD